MDKIQLGERAKALLEDPLISGFFDEYEKQLFQRWSEESDKAVRDEIYGLKVAADAFKIHLNSYVVSGQIFKEVAHD